MSELCPAHCVNLGCPQPSFLEANQTFLLTVIGIGGSSITVLLAYFLKSRCSSISVCWGFLSCIRKPLPIDATDIEIQN